MENKEKNLFVERETYKKNGNEYFSYFIKGIVRGKNVKVLISPPDLGGFTVLDIVFGDANQVDFVINPFELTDEKTGKTVTGNSYAVRSSDESGKLYECKVKPLRSSDKALLNMLLN